MLAYKNILKYERIPKSKSNKTYKIPRKSLRKNM